MRTLTTRIIPMILIVLSSCATVDEQGTQPTIPTNDLSILLELANTSWTLDDCPADPALNLEGYTACQYLNYLTITEENIFIRHGNNPYFTSHNICFVDGKNFVISRQGCGFTEWTGVSEWEVVDFGESTLEIDVRFPNLSPGYNERFIFTGA